MPLSGASYSAVELSADGGELFVLDQRRLPHEEIYLTYVDVGGAAESIRDMVVRGAPAIGITAAYGMALAARAAEGDYLRAMRAAGEQLIATRPTAVNLAWAVHRCLALAEEHATEPPELRSAQMAELARAIHREDVAACKEIGRLGAERILSDRKGELRLLTHCNAGALATGGYGTALGVVRGIVEAGVAVHVTACETRPYLQGARLTAWELHKDGIDVRLISDSMVAHCMQRGLVQAVVVGADRIAKNGDVANKIGTYGIACLAKHHGIPFFVAAPWSTVDLATVRGADIVIEERRREELTHIGDRELAPAGVGVFNPAFDVTPAELVTAIITERGVFDPSALGRS